MGKRLMGPMFPVWRQRGKQAKESRHVDFLD
jgi:hypothetical protein